MFYCCPWKQWQLTHVSYKLCYNSAAKKSTKTHTSLTPHTNQQAGMNHYIFCMSCLCKNHLSICNTWGHELAEISIPFGPDSYQINIFGEKATLDIFTFNSLLFPALILFVHNTFSDQYNMQAIQSWPNLGICMQGLTCCQYIHWKSLNCTSYFMKFYFYSSDINVI